MRSVFSFTVALAIVAGASVAGAQDMGGTTTISTNQVPPSTATVSGESVTTTSGVTDHSVVAGHLALRYFGPTQLRALASDAMAMGGTGVGSATLQTVGIRYWLNGNLGLDLGLSLGLTSGSANCSTNSSPDVALALAPGGSCRGNGDMSGRTISTASDDPSFFGFGLYGAVPLMLAESKHVSIHLDPFVRLAFGRSAITTGTGPSTVDTSLSSFLFGVGANVAAELQFGFLGVPQLGLIGQFGLQLSFQNASLSRNQTAVNINTTASASQFFLGTTVGPGYGLADIISGSLSAVWYFGGQPGAHN